VQEINARLERRERSLSSKCGTVLIVDDHESTCETLSRGLSIEGFTVVTASTANDGIRLAARVKPQTILLDYHLPDMDGLSCLGVIRERLPAGRVIIFTADWEVEAMRDKISALGGSIASKLCDIDDVVRLVATSVKTKPADSQR
jgi:DNA-binding response OmpR family regulator